ncbi:MAG: outer membrane beta-barrel protein [Planctomycetes bacterium]|nr:outer membrane beta-barrel protein [Planctomycetota bacterium]
MRFGKILFACVIAFTPLLFVSQQVAAQQDLSDTEIGEFRAILAERALAKEAPAGPLTDEEAGAVRGMLDQFKGITFGGFVENFYQYEGYTHPNAGDSVAINPKVFDRQNNSFTVNNMELWLYKETPNPGDIGFKMTLNWGDTARRVTFVGPVFDDGTPQPNPPGAPTGGRQTTFTEGFVQWNIPIGKGITTKFGKFATWVGYEVWEAQWNPNFSRSYIYGWGIPFTNTGVGVSYPVTDRFTADYYFVNSSDTFVNNNTSFTHGVQLDYAVPDFLFVKDMNLHFDGLWGPENAADNNAWNQIYDVSMAFSPYDKFTLVTNGNWNRNGARGVQNSGRTVSNPTSWGIAQYIVYQHNDMIGGAIRGEYFWDQDNRAGISGGGGSSLAEITGTINLKIREKMFLRPEIRYDKVVHTPFISSNIWNRMEDKALTGSFAVTYEF